MKWTVEFFEDARGRSPVLDFIQKKSKKRRGQLIIKPQHAANLGRELAGPPLVVFLRDSIHRLKCRQQDRILFSWEEDSGILLALEVTVKKNGKIDERAIDRAARNREEWLEKRKSVPMEEALETLGAK